MPESRSTSRSGRFRGHDRLHQRELGLTGETVRQMSRGGALLLAVERSVRVATNLVEREALVAGCQRRFQDVVFHRLTAAFSFRLALTINALAPLVLVSPSAV